MEVEIGEIVSIVRAIDSESILTPKIMEAIVRSVMEAVEAREQHNKRIRGEQRITLGVSHELEEYE